MARVEVHFAGTTSLPLASMPRKLDFRQCSKLLKADLVIGNMATEE